MTPVASAPGGSAPRLTAGLIACIASAALAGLLFGFDTAVISGTTAGLRAREKRREAATGAALLCCTRNTLPKL